MSYRFEISEAVQGLAVGASGHVRVTCPACIDRAGSSDRKRSCSVNMRNGWWRCFRCDFRGRLPGYEDGDGYEDESEGWEDVPSEIEEPSDFHDLPGFSRALEAAREYLRGRGISYAAVKGARLGYAIRGAHKGRIIMPIDSPSGEPLGWVGRSVVKGARPYHTAAGMDRRRVFYGDAKLHENSGEPLVVTEGAFDALKQWPHAVACLGKPTPDHIERLRALTRPVVIALDGDAWREGLAIARALRLSGSRAYALALPPCEDLGSMEPGEVSAAVSWAVSNESDADLRGAA